MLHYITPMKRVREQRVKHSFSDLTNSFLFLKLMLRFGLDFEFGLGLTLGLGLEFGLGFGFWFGIG